MERSVFPLLFGACHALFLDNLFVQTIVLFAVELCYLILKIVVLRSRVPRHKFKVSMCALSSMLRLIFIVTFYIYQTTNQPAFMNAVHFEVVSLYVLFWLIEFFHDFVLFLSDIKQAIFGLCKSKTPTTKSHTKGAPKTENRVKISDGSNLKK
jgi:hypothetical protein